MIANDMVMGRDRFIFLWQIVNALHCILISKRKYQRAPDGGDPIRKNAPDSMHCQ
ncbi:MAG: hypothetical protein PVH87_26830 [Desulfobacteraceae bacterium]|jgi:hypothetical protein